MRPAGAIVLAVALLAAAASAGCGLGGESGESGESPTGASAEGAAANLDESVRPSPFARQSIPAPLLRRYRQMAERLGVDWAMLAACDQTGLFQADAEDTTERARPGRDSERIAGVAEMLSDPEGKFCATGVVEALAESYRRSPAAQVPRAEPPLELPAEGRAIARFGMRFGVFHNGIDVATDAESPVTAAAAGVVVYAAWHPVYGDYSCVVHRFRPQVGGRGELTTCYGYQSSLTVEVGDVVEGGQVIGYVGCPEGCIQPIVHLQVRDGPSPRDQLTDPAPFLADDVEVRPGRPLDPA